MKIADDETREGRKRRWTKEATLVDLGNKERTPAERSTKKKGSMTVERGRGWMIRRRSAGGGSGSLDGRDPVEQFPDGVRPGNEGMMKRERWVEKWAQSQRGWRCRSVASEQALYLS